MTAGKSGDRVVRLDTAAGETLFVKIAVGANQDTLLGERDRLLWLEQAGVAAPRMEDLCVHGDASWLVMTAVAGRNALLSSETPATKVRLVAEALRALHGIDAATCPFDETLAVKLSRASDNVAARRVDDQDLCDDHVGMSPEALFERAVRLRPSDEDLVVTHGDATLDNVILKGGVFAGFVDCGRLGRADRYQDLAIMARNIRSNLDPSLVETFLDAYGLTSVDIDRLYYYRLLDEFF